MGHVLYANNTVLEPLHMGLSWLYLLEQCGSYFTCISQGARWYMIFDERMTTHFHFSDEREDREAVIVVLRSQRKKQKSWHVLPAIMQPFSVQYQSHLRKSGIGQFLPLSICNHSLN